MRTWSRPPSRGSARSLAGTDIERTIVPVWRRKPLFLEERCVLTSPHCQDSGMRIPAVALWLSTSPVAALLLSPVRISRAPVAAADAKRCDVVAKYFAPLETPAAYEELLAGASNESISVIKFVSAHCRTCRAAEPKLEAFAKRWPGASFHSLVLKKDGKMAGKRRASNPPTLGGPGPSHAGPP